MMFLYYVDDTSEIMMKNLTDVTGMFGGLEVACWPLVPKFAGSNPVEGVTWKSGIFRQNSSAISRPCS